MPAQTQLPASLVRFEVTDGVATIVVNRPDALNAYNKKVIQELHEAFRRAIAADEVRGIVLGGEGKVFMVGGDIDFLVRSIEAREVWRIAGSAEDVRRLIVTIDRSPKPVVARLGGAALGGGFEFALACDNVVASPAATMGFPETGLGIYPCSGGTQRTSRLVGVGLTKWLIYTGKTLSAREAHAMGLIHQVVHAERLDDVCRAIARGGPCPPRSFHRIPPLDALERFFAHNRVGDLYGGTADCGGDPALIRAMKQVAAKAPVALRLAERIIDEGSRTVLEEGVEMEMAHVVEVFSTEDAYRGLVFRAKRGLGRPTFIGR